MTNTILLATWQAADRFLGSGGTTQQIVNPTFKDLEQYVLYFEKLKNSNPLKNNFCDIALWTLREVVKDKYPNPQLWIALSKDNTLCGLIFFYEILDQGEPFNWIEAWADDGTDGAGTLLAYQVGDISAQKGLNLCGNPNPEIYPPMSNRPFMIQDPTTNWYKITAKQMIELGTFYKDAALETQYFSKIIQDSFAWLEKGTN
jgi:hypothetical protein